MEGKPKKFAILLTLLVGPILVFLGICLPWFFFAGTAQYYWGMAEVSGRVSLIGTGTLDRTRAQVTMWSSPNWSTAESDFWYGYLSVGGLVVVLASVIVFLKTNRPRTSMLLALIGSSLNVLAWLMAVVYYEPYIFVIKGQIDAIPGVDGARLYATQAAVNNGLGPWLSLIGSILFMITTYFFVHLKIRKK